MNNNTAQLDWTEMERRAANMTEDALHYAAADAWEAAQAAELLERAGCAVSKTGGYYRDEATVYRAELRRRGVELGR